MGAEALEHYLSDRSRRGPAAEGAFSGSAGGAPCGDLLRISIGLGDGSIERVTQDAEGCAPSRAAAAAVAELVAGAPLLEAAAISA
ncbi:MAG: iron-sulfur cluster assembly scaffold protein, partial [Actinomycetota bacterium]|nr:iron-sulfur cluster assembly scaffold protein [Actinomycetota bacterium]